MPLEILTGPEVPALLARAQRSLGEDAVVVSVRRVNDRGRRLFEVVAADPATAERQRSDERLARSRRPTAPAPTPRPVTAPDDDARFWNLERAPEAETVPPATPPAGRRRPWAFPTAGAARDGRRPRVVALVGPTGAGKTTTIAKLASHPQAFGGRRVGLLCLDTWRIGGVEQARQYAELSRLAFEVVWETRDVARAMRRLRDCAVVLVDTPGRGPRAAGDLREIMERLLALSPDEVHLALPAGLQRVLAQQIVTAHLPLGVTHLLPTKLDEFPDVRGAFEISRRFGLPMRWFADGQEVPRDLQLAPSQPTATLVPEAV